MHAHAFLYDLTSIIGVVPDLELVSLTPQPDGIVRVKGLTEHRDIVLYARTREPVDGLNLLCGLDLSAAKSALHAPGMSPGAIESLWEGDQSVHLRQGYQHYRVGLMGKGYTEQVLKVPPLKSAVKYQAFATPTTEGNALLKYWRKELIEVKGESYDFQLDLTTQGNTMLATFRSGPRESIVFPLTEFCAGAMSCAIRVRSNHLMQLLALVERTKSTIAKVCDRGLVTIEVETTYCVFEFHLVCGVERGPPEWRGD
jgi:hypothetical protein